MKPINWNKLKVIVLMALLALLVLPNTSFAQDKKSQALDQNISIYAEDEPLSDVIEKICKYLNLDYSYNAAIVEDKKISLNISNKPIKYVLDKLMKDFYLLFEIEDNLLVVRDYVPIDKSMEFENTTQQFASNNRGFLFDDPRDKNITIKFKSASNLIIIPVTINNSDTLNFILDTGVRFPIITELPFINKLNLNYMMPIEVKGLGDGESLTAYRSGNNMMQIDGLTARNQEVQMIIDENFQISHMLGIPVHGLIGFNLFKDYVVKVDYLNEKLTLIKPEYYKYRDRKKDIIMPLHFDGNKPFVRTTIVTDDMKEVPVKLLVDTGASDALWLSESSDERIGLPSKHVETFLGRGLSGDLYGTKGRIDAIWVGPLLLTKPIVAFPNSDLIDSLISQNDRNGTIGAEILRRFYVTVDYRNSRLTLRPNHKIKEDFNYNMSGMEVTNPMPGLPIFTIADIRENSPAHLAGLQKNDQILSINSSSHRTLELNDINLLLQSKENKKIKLKVLRNGEEFKTSFELKKMF
ncbi:aspartyl protease family protein [uncultured Draconibacterium sp.]|uniref:aspartyl protease family protein n=1 Tax=uncultured Draconibacterium sp. TaxID=1573823 RepID=UPI0025CC06F5|nr:aspartyl protease family protein [uncultured Draconibacterium sp.]